VSTDARLVVIVDRVIFNAHIIERAALHPRVLREQRAQETARPRHDRVIRPRARSSGLVIDGEGEFRVFGDME